MSEILGTNPRALKRFVNIYRVIKAHEDFYYTNEAEEGELLAVMFLIALPLGKYRKLVKIFEDFIVRDVNEDGSLRNFLSSIDKNLDHYKHRSEVYDIFYIQQNNILNQQKEVFRKHNTFIKRFTFNILL